MGAHRSSLVFSLIALLCISDMPAFAETNSIFTTDELSFISFGDTEVVPIPVGSTIKFRFGEPAADGSVPFTIQPGDVDIAPIELGGQRGRLAYKIQSVASGTLSPTPSGHRLAFQARVRATLVRAGGGGSFDYVMPFTTDEATARSLDGSQTLSTYGMRVVDGVWFAQIVGATTNKRNAFPEPGAAVYTVLSGEFDTFPEVPGS